MIWGFACACDIIQTSQSLWLEMEGHRRSCWYERQLAGSSRTCIECQTRLISFCSIARSGVGDKPRRESPRNPIRLLSTPPTNTSTQRRSSVSTSAPNPPLTSSSTSTNAVAIRANNAARHSIASPYYYRRHRSHHHHDHHPQQLTPPTTTNLAYACDLSLRDRKAHGAFKQLNRVLDSAQVVFCSEVYLGSTRTARVVECLCA